MHKTFNIPRRTDGRSVGRRSVGRVDADADGRAARRRTQAAGDVPLISNNAALKLQNSESRIPIRK